MTTPNKRYPGRPNYTGPKSGFFLLPFHADIVTWMPDIFSRLETIDKIKPQNEIAWRRHCMVYVRPSELPPKVATACKAYNKALRKRLGVKGGISAAEYNKRCAACRRALQHWVRVGIVYEKLLTALLTKHVPGHTWNGRELVLPKAKK